MMKDGFNTRRWCVASFAILAATLTMMFLALSVFDGSPAGAATTTCPSTSVSAPIEGSWYVQVHFPGPPIPGGWVGTIETFGPGGAVTEANPENTSPAANSGYWHLNADCTYSVRLDELTYDPTTSGIKQVVEVHLTYVMTGPDELHSTATDTTFANYNPQTGQMIEGPIVLPNVSTSVGTRFDKWEMPASFPPEP